MRIEQRKSTVSSNNNRESKSHFIINEFVRNYDTTVIIISLNAPD